MAHLSTGFIVPNYSTTKSAQHEAASEPTDIPPPNDTFIENIDPQTENANEIINKNQEIKDSSLSLENTTSSGINTNSVLSALISHNPVIVRQLNLTEDSAAANLIYSRPSSSSDECEVVVVEKCFTQQTQKCVTTYVKESKL